MHESVKCFGCDAWIEADGADEVVDAFVVHGQVSHSWPYPQGAIRNYARSYAEASERQGIPSQRTRSQSRTSFPGPTVGGPRRTWIRADHGAGTRHGGAPIGCFCPIVVTAAEPVRSSSWIRGSQFVRILIRTSCDGHAQMIPLLRCPFVVNALCN